MAQQCQEDVDTRKRKEGRAAGSNNSKRQELEEKALASFPKGVIFTKTDLDQFRSTLLEYQQEWFDTFQDQLLNQAVPEPNRMDWRYVAGYSVDRWKRNVLEAYLSA